MAAVILNLFVILLICSLLNVVVTRAGAGGGAPLPYKFCRKTVSPDYCTYCFFRENPSNGADNSSTPTDLGNLAIGCMMKETSVFQKLLNRYINDHNLNLRRRALMCVTLMDTVLQDLRAAGWSLDLRRFQQAVHSAQLAKVDLNHCTDLFDARLKIPASLSADLLKIEAYAANTPEILAQIDR